MAILPHRRRTDVTASQRGAWLGAVARLRSCRHRSLSRRHSARIRWGSPVVRFVQAAIAAVFVLLARRRSGRVRCARRHDIVITLKCLSTSASAIAHSVDDPQAIRIPGGH